MFRLTRLLLLTVLCAAAIGGCGSSGGDSGEAGGGEPTARATTPEAPPGASARACDGAAAGVEQVRVTGVGCDAGRGVVAAWAAAGACSSPPGESRYSCSVGGYRCLGAATARGIAVSCSRPGSSVSFLAGRG